MVAIESLKFPGHFLSFDRSGNAMVHRWPLEAQDVQFTIRVNVSYVTLDSLIHVCVHACACVYTVYA